VSERAGGSGWAKAPTELVVAFSAVMDRFPEAERRSMFGYPCAFLGGHMFTGLHSSNWFVRLRPDDLERFLDQDGAARFEPMPGRPMAGYVVFPPAATADLDDVGTWVSRALEHVRSLPPKEAKRAGAKRGGQSGRASSSTT
jgi:hypothetical protein